MKKTLAFPLMFILLCGCRFTFDSENAPKPLPAPPIPPDPLAGCWKPDIKTSEQQLVQQIALTSFAKSLPADFTPSQTNQIKQSFW